MATMELDPLFVKALGFLRSKTKESADQLRDLLNDVISGGPGKSKIDRPTTLGNIKGVKDRGLLKTSKKLPSSPLRKPEETKRDVEKRTADRAKLDSSDSDVAPIKKSKVERPQRQPAKPIIEDISDSDDTDDSNQDSSKEDATETNAGGSTDADDFALELGLACVMCKRMDVSAGNQLIECQECHCLYHQQCHKPAATNADPNDPRLVWYCAKCARNMKRQASKKPKSLPSSGRDSKAQSFEKSEETAMNLFKRSEPKTVSPSGTSKQPLAGLASMAANLSGRPTTTTSKPSKPAPMPAGIAQRSNSRSSVTSPVSKTVPSAPKTYTSTSSSSKSSSASSSKSGSSSSKGSNAGKSAPSQTSTASAMKRLHMMKKKASKR